MRGREGLGAVVAAGRGTGARTGAGVPGTIWELGRMLS